MYRLSKFLSLVIGVLASILPAGASGDPATSPVADAESSGKIVMVINGRTFDFPVPEKVDHALFSKVQEQFLIGALNTPSPPRQIWSIFDDLIGDKKQREFVSQYLSSRPKPTEEELKTFLDRIKQQMIFVKGGTFDMGDYGFLTPKKLPMTDNDIDDPPHKVRIDSYSLMKNRVTFADYDFYTSATRLPPIAVGTSVASEVRFPNFPALLTWQQGRDYCQWLAKETGQNFDIDTEAQYEYAARSGGKWLYLASTFEKLHELVPDLQKFKKLADAEDKDIAPEQNSDGVPIGTYGHNYLGFEDMMGWTKEWVYDWFSVYTDAPQVNPRGPESDEQKVVRLAPIGEYGTTYRQSLKPEYPYAAFRCSISSTQPWK